MIFTVPHGFPPWDRSRQVSQTVTETKEHSVYGSACKDKIQGFTLSQDS